ncbi:MAG TPA: AIR synthase related protein [Candidatus Deferrimicrobium sp.]|nr:AIR synthase related protein [Candidatus Deferrimicrobium sp.]
MNIKELAASIAQFEGIKRKYPISEVILPLTEKIIFNYPQIDILRSFGEDSAVIGLSEISYTHYFLLAMDGMWSKLIQADPELAGYFAILVNVNDITCKGGIPIACVDMLSFQNETIGKALVKGMIQGSKKFGVPIVGGHLHPNNAYNSLSIAIFGIVPREQVIFSNGAQVGDDILIAVDLDGKFNEKFPFAWDTTSHKTPEQVQTQCRIMQNIAKRKLVHAAKDISNPGIVGTLGMLLDASNFGGTLDISQIPIRENQSIQQWLCMYPGFGLVLTCDPSHSNEIIRIFSENKIAARICGFVQDLNSLYLSDGNEKALIFDFKTNNIAGIP